MASPSPDHQAKTHEQLGKLVEGLVVKDYVNLLGSTKRQIWRTVVIGFFAGLAGVLGATLGVALLLYLLSQFSQIPGLGHVAHNVKQTIQSYRPAPK